MADPFEALVAAKPAAPAAPDPFAALVSQPQPQSQPHADPFAALVQKPAEAPIETRAWEATKNFAKTAVGTILHPGGSSAQVEQAGQDATDAASYLGSKVMGSPVGSVLRGLNTAEQAVTAATVYAADKTVAPGIQQKLNPENRWAPDIAFHDVIHYAMPSNDAAQALFEKYGIDGRAAQAGRLLYATAKTGLGLAADLFTDPLMYVGVGELSEAGKALDVQRLNAVAEGTLTAEQATQKAERYAVSFGVGKAKVGITTDAAAGAIKAVPGGAKALAGASKVVDGAANVLKSLDYRTGIPEVDAAASIHAALKRGDYQAIYDNFVSPMREYKFMPAEHKVLAAAIESTGNEATKEEILASAKEHATRLEAAIPETRLDQIAEAGAKIKGENLADLAERTEKEIFNPNIDQTIENYLVHKMSPEAKRWIQKNPELAAGIQEAILKETADKGVRDSVLSTYDSGKRSRELRTTLEQANGIMKEKTGVNSWFIEDPILATAMKRADTKRLLRDSELIERMEKFGVERKTARELGLNWKPLEIPDYKGSLPAKDLVFPPKITDRIGYYIAPKETGPFLSYIDSFNRVFRNVALFKADYYIRNWNENLFKNWVQGVRLSDYNDVLKVSRNKGAIEIGGKMVDASEIRAHIAKYGIDSGGQFREGVNALLNTGRKLESERVLVRAAGGTADALKRTVNLLREGGEVGENATRRALFVNRLKQGYSPAAAALEVEKYLFDYARTSSRMDAVRRFWNPFFQHAYKTMLITPEMLMKAPGKYNFLHNNMMEALQAGMQDPVSADEVKAIIPAYQRIHDPIVGPILKGNSWLRRIFTNQTAIDKGGKLGTAILFKNDIGESILNQFAIWDNEIGKSGGLVAPFMRSLGMVAFGRDPFTMKVIDPTTQSADMARRFNHAANAFIEGSVPIPETWKFVKQSLGIGDPQYFTPMAVQLLHGTLGKFVTVTDLDREYAFRMMSFQTAHKELQKALMSQAAKERSGRTADIALSDKPFLKSIVDLAHTTESSSYLYNKMLQNRNDAMLVRDSAAGLMGEMSTAEIVKHLKDLDKTITQQSKQYEAIQAYRMEQLKNAPKADIQQMAPGSNPK